MHFARRVNVVNSGVVKLIFWKILLDSLKYFVGEITHCHEISSQLGIS
jgi:hypothetical protein